MKVVQRKDRIESAGGLAAFVVFDEPELIRRTMLEDVEVPFPVVVDTERGAYEAWGLQRAPWWRIWLDPNVWKQYWNLLRDGERFRDAGKDPQQLGGDFLVSPDGRLAYARPQERDDRPPAGELVDRLGELAT